MAAIRPCRVYLEVLVAIEIEDKFDVPDEFVVPDLLGVKGVEAVSGPKSHQLVAVYFDTPDLRLAARGITLRRRRGGDDPGWHLKLPKAAGVRQEIQLPLTRSAKVVPADLAAQVLVYTRGHALVPVAELDTKRSVTRLLDGDEQVLAEVADDRVKGTVYGDVPRVERWREVEVELVKGDEALLKRVGKRVIKAGAVTGGSANKLGRLLGEAVQELPKSPAEGTVGAAVFAYLRSQTDALIAQDGRVRRAEEDAVHKARVACRRMRSAFKAFSSIVTESDVLQEELRWLGEVLGEVRDLEVIQARFGKELDGLDDHLIVGPVRTRLLDDLKLQEEEGYERAREAMTSERYFALLDALDEPYVFTGRATREAGPELAKIVAKEWKRVHRKHATAQAIDDPHEREIAMHDVRKAAKRARYTAEAAGMDDEAARAEAIQEALGTYQDGVVAQETLEKEAAKAREAGEDTFTYGVLAGLERAAAERARDRFPKLWKKLR
ncbi:CYTH and CHAD domain-containing protein [Herbidospora solisilvae]|uniref:CYTH and CHAD domain-containing protein n=1 Tax=Herbidospora solisilvae TaxID=2696284 RepID=UPI001929DF1A|nr:CYTH and CHAD domain-containing protein [Herbidospora solisilvae]